MKKVFFDAIRAGRKRQTLRYWRRRTVRPGQVHTIPGLGKVYIDEVAVIPPEALTEADALADGFASLDELQRALAEMYTPDQRADRSLYCIRFTYPAPQPA